MPRKPRKCEVCKAEIEFDINNCHNIARLKDKYYHSDCLVKLATERVKKPRHAEYWDYALEHLDACEKEAKDTLTYTYWQDKLNDHLVRHYDVVSFPQRFWNIISDLTNGEFKGKRCRAVPMQTVCEAWIWAQRKLDEISRKNKMQHKGPKTDLERANYDLSIVVGHIGDYEKAKAKEKAAETEKELKATTKIDYNSLTHRSEVKNEGLDDISEMIDDFF